MNPEAFPQPPPTGDATEPGQTGVAQHGISFGEAARVWVRVAVNSFGGPAGQIAVMHRIIVEEKRWISENRFLHALNYCMLLPGPEAQQLATYIGWLLHRTAGGLVAGGLFVLPGFVAILGMSILYAQFQTVPLVEGLFFGIKAAVLAVVVEAVLRIGRRALRNNIMVGVAVAAFVAIFFFAVPYPAIVIAAAGLGWLGGRLAPERFQVVKGHAVDALALVAEHWQHTQPSWGRALRVLAIWLTLWFAPLIWLATLGPQWSTFEDIGWFFSKSALVTFGGAYSALAYVAQAAVDSFGWLRPGEMLDGLGLAESTPGPLIMVVQFVGFMGAYRFPGPLDPLTAAVLASVLTTWVTFVPCFLWIFLGAPSIEALRGNAGITAALSGITAAVVGVVLNLGVWFAIHTLFAEVNDLRWGALRLNVPDLTTLRWGAAALTAVALLAVFRLRLGMLWTIALCAAVGVALRLIAG